MFFKFSPREAETMEKPKKIISWIIVLFFILTSACWAAYTVVKREITETKIRNENTMLTAQIMDEQQKYRKEIIRNKCQKCVHDYNGKTVIVNVVPFFRAVLKRRYSMLLYEIICRVGIL